MHVRHVPLNSTGHLNCAIYPHSDLNTTLNIIKHGEGTIPKLLEEKSCTTRVHVWKIILVSMCSLIREQNTSTDYGELPRRLCAGTI